MELTETGEKGTLDATDALLGQIKTYIEAEILPRLRQGDSSLDKVKLTDTGVRTPFTSLIESLSIAVGQAEEVQRNLAPHRGVQDVVSATPGVAATTEYYQRT